MYREAGMAVEVQDKRGILENYQSRPKVVLELGCGPIKKVPDSIAIDRVNEDHVDILADFNQGLGFLSDNSVDEIHSYHLLEHLDDLEGFLREVHRVLKPGGQKIGTVPHFANPFFYSDYTHKNTFGLYSFSYFTKERYLRRVVPTFYNDLDFKIRQLKLVFNSPFRERAPFKKMVGLFFNSFRYIQEFYEENLVYICPPYEIRFVIEKR